MDFLDGRIFDFPHGVPGFETATRFCLKEQPSFAPVSFLQATDAPDLCFLVIPVQSILPDYSLAIAADDLSTLQLDDAQPGNGKDVLCLAILTAPEQGPLTANLLAPVVINLAAGRGVQAVRSDSVYSHRHVIAALETEAGC
jgi:flagellar assembly factor FliW